MKLTSLVIDVVKVESGEWIRDLPDCDDLEILSKGIACIACKRMQQAKIIALPRDQRIPRVPPDVMERITLESVAETCIMDWRNLTDGKGKEMPFSREEIRKIVADKRYEPLHTAFVVAASRVGDGRAEDVEVAAKN